MKKMFSMGVMIHATAYVLAENAEEAAKKAQEHFLDATLQLSDRRQEAGEVIITGERYSPRMPEVTLSSAMTMGAVDTSSVELSDDFGASDEEEDPCGQCEGTGTIVGGLGGDGADEQCPVCEGSGRLKNRA